MGRWLPATVFHSIRSSRPSFSQHVVDQELGRRRQHEPDGAPDQDQHQACRKDAAARLEAWQGR